MSARTASRASASAAILSQVSGGAETAALGGRGKAALTSRP